jgi:hypothetical protein
MLLIYYVFVLYVNYVLMLLLRTCRLLPFAATIIQVSGMRPKLIRAFYKHGND